MHYERWERLEVSATPEKIVVLVDYRGHFWSSVRKIDIGMNLDALEAAFADLGVTVEILRFPEVDLRRRSFAGLPVLYQSSEDRGSLYKGYIEDIVLGLTLQGAVPVPRFECLRAHHNKVFMEILRDVSDDLGLQAVGSRSFGTLEDYEHYHEKTDAAQVIKSAEGSSSLGVALLDDVGARHRLPRRLSRSYHLIDSAKNRAKIFLRPWYAAKSNHRRKFIVQDFVPELAGDFKVLVYWDRYYVLQRGNRKNDFRASGSGLFEYRRELPDGLLDFVKAVFRGFEVPCISIDLAWTGSEFIPLEFQFVTFGSYTLVHSPFYFVAAESGNGWTVVEEPSQLEEVFARSVVAFLRQSERTVPEAHRKARALWGGDRHRQAANGCL